MRLSEAKYIRHILENIGTEYLSPCVNLGSSTGHFRKVAKPHIHDEIIAPLEARGVSIFHSDLKADEGVDFSGDIFDIGTQTTLSSLNIQLLLCCNMMEHVESPQILAEILDRILPEKAYLLVSVPRCYPLHFDPIDTYFRPSPERVVELFPNFNHVESSVVVSTTYFQDVLHDKNRRSAALKLSKKLVTAVYPFFGAKEWKRRHHRLLWLFRRYTITCVLLQKK